MEVDGSLSARRAWIEIFVPFDVIRPAIVALRKESVDRNEIAPLSKTIPRGVALRKESVDRNLMRKITITVDEVALRKESVDRNTKTVALEDPESGRSPQGERG